MKTLGLDIGTTSVSAVVYDTQLGVLAAKTVKNDSFLPSQSWERIQDPNRIREIAEAAVKELLALHPEVSAMGLTGQMHGILYLDGAGDCVSPLYTWQDGRGDLPHPEGGTWASRLSEITGYPVATGYGMATHFYNVRHGLVPEGAAAFCTIHDYLAMKFSGNTAPKMDPTDAASLGLFDARRGGFDREALERAGLDVGMLPRLMDSPCLGTGPLGIPVYAAIGDNQASFLGASGGRTDVLLVNVGTGSQISVYSPVHMHTDTLETRPFPDQGWLLVGASLCGGRSYAMLESFFRQTVKMVTGADDSVYAAMTRALDEAGTVTDAPRAVTTFQGTRKDPGRKGGITEIGTDNFTPVHFMHSIMQGMARELYDMYAGYLEKGGVPPKTIIGSGNGLRKNRHLCRIFEAVFGCSLELSPNDEEAACGAAVYAAKHILAETR